jgi:predicted aspartyl protease
MLPVLVAACASDAPSDCKMALVTDLKLLPSSGTFITPAFLNGQPTTMILDTGSMDTLISKSSAERLHLSLNSTGTWISGIGGHQSLYLFTADSFRIGKLHGAHLTLAASAIGTDPRHFPIDGIFGAEFLSHYDIDFDVADRKLRLFKVISGCTQPAANLDEPLYQAPLERPFSEADRRPHVMVLINGIWLNAVVDSGAQHTAIFRDSARRLGLRLEDLAADPHGRASGLGPSAKVEIQHIMAPIKIGEITISNLPVHIIDQRSGGDTDMLLGLDFFSRVHVWLSFHSGTMLMQYPPKASPKLPD